MRAFCYNQFMRILLLILVVIVFAACETRAVIDRDSIQKPLPEGWEFVDKKTEREVLRPSKLEDIVPEDF